MSEVAEVAQVATVILNGMQMGAKATKEFFRLVVRMFQILVNIPEKWTAHKLKKTSGKTKLKHLQLKDNVTPCVIADDFYEFLKKKGKKYNIQWTKAVKINGTDKKHIFVSSNDMGQYKALVDAWTRKTGKSPEDGSRKQTLMEYMYDSGLATCSDKEFDAAMNEYANEVLGKKSYKKITKADIDKELDLEKKNKMIDMVHANDLYKKMRSTDNMTMTFSIQSIVDVNEKNQKAIAVQGSLGDVMWIDDRYIHSVPGKKDSFVVVIPSEKDVLIQNLQTKKENRDNIWNYMEKMKDKKKPQQKQTSTGTRTKTKKRTKTKI